MDRECRYILWIALLLYNMRIPFNVVYIRLRRSTGFYFNFYAPPRPRNMCALLVSWNRKWVAAACVHVRRRSYKCHGLYATYWKVCRSTRIFLAHLSRHTIQFQWKNKNTIVSRNRNNEHFSSMRCRFKYAGLGIKANVSQMFSCDGI